MRQKWASDSSSGRCNLWPTLTPSLKSSWLASCVTSSISSILFASSLHCSAIWQQNWNKINYCLCFSYMPRKPIQSNFKYYIGCVRLASLGRPWSAPVHSNSFDGAHRVSPQCPACGVGHLRVTWGACRHHERASVIIRLALVRGSPKWVLRDRTREAYRMHP